MAVRSRTASLPALPRRPSRTAAGFDCNDQGCRVSLVISNGVLIVRDAATEDNKTAADFYNSTLWPKVRLWERLFWAVNGGEKRARDVVLGRLPKRSGLRLLDVAIGDGVYTSWLPEDWSIVGVDVSTSQLAACRRRNSSRDLRLVLGEAEDLPFRDREFDAVLSNGGFNHFNDPEAALREMARVAKPGALWSSPTRSQTFSTLVTGWACQPSIAGLPPKS